FKATLGNLDPDQKLTNTAWLAWSSLPGDVTRPQSSYNATSTERFYDPDSRVNTYGVSAQTIISTPELPSTGFAPAQLTPLPQQHPFYSYQPLNNLWLEIPKLNLRTPITGVPLNNINGWDLTWLSSQVGWLEGTAFPTWKGNSALTAHVYLANGQPGPFFNLNTLRWGDQIIVHLGSQRYIYEVREMRRVKPDDLSILRHEKHPWLTLITCQEYDAKTDSYQYRFAVRAVQIKIEPEP
ncbi:MAG: sortase, partial [Thermanaerothrix sp.]|nr:sortase [Thermanaerothrix sp.]